LEPASHYAKVYLGTEDKQGPEFAFGPSDSAQAIVDLAERVESVGLDMSRTTVPEFAARGAGLGFTYHGLTGRADRA
jgi:hypothetical protein